MKLNKIHVYVISSPDCKHLHCWRFVLMRKWVAQAVYTTVEFFPLLLNLHWPLAFLLLPACLRKQTVYIWQCTIMGSKDLLQRTQNTAFIFAVFMAKIHLARCVFKWSHLIFSMAITVFTLVYVICWKINLPKQHNSSSSSILSMPWYVYTFEM